MLIISTIVIICGNEFFTDILSLKPHSIPRIRCYHVSSKMFTNGIIIYYMCVHKCANLNHNTTMNSCEPPPPEN